ncbi:MAG: Gfo/Idh/MocA family oxidoreductase [Chloroflexota bacterium]|nr:Gfo/Idh/MocA family oxidoreductase [Chloroflexota bacterium]
MRVAVLGVGRLGASHAANIRALPDVTSLRIYDADPARAADVARPLGADVAPSIDAALDGADASVIVTPTGTHAAIIRRCVDAGIATFCEKPVALGLEETRAVADHVERTGARLQIGFQRRFDAGYQRARRMLREGEVGTVYSFYMVSRDAAPPPDEYVATSGGHFKDQLIHDFDIIRWLFADEVEDLYATGSVLGFERYRDLGDIATAGVALRLRAGAVGLVSGARHNPAGYDIRVEIYGSRDSIAIGLDPRSPIHSVEADATPLAGPAYPSFFVRFGDAYRAELEHFLRFARGEAENPCTARDGLEALRIAEAAERSRREARSVRLSEIG